MTTAHPVRQMRVRVPLKWQKAQLEADMPLEITSTAMSKRGNVS
jgi:hypothetical protein